jgi:hypothetical protein
MPLPSDIIAKVERDFAEGEVAPAIELIGKLSAEDNGTFTDRVLRCLVHMSKGSFSGLTRAVALARKDWRDVIYFSEYDSNDVRVRDLSEPFQLDV